MARRAAIIIEAVDKATPTFARIRGGLLGLGAVAGAVGLVQLGRQLVSGLVASVQAAAEAQDAQLGLAHSIARSGQSVQAVLPGLERQATALQRVTGFSDEAIKKGQSLLITLGHLRGEGLERATKAALDLAAKLGLDLEQAFSVVSKAAAGNFTTLQKLTGLHVTGKDQAAKFASALTLIEKAAGGAAAERLTKFSGQTDLLNENLGELSETIGNALLPLGQALLRDFLNPIVQNLADTAEGSDDLGKTFLELALAMVPVMRSFEFFTRQAKGLAEIGLQGAKGNFAGMGLAAIDLARDLDTASPATDRFQRSIEALIRTGTDPKQAEAMANLEKLGKAAAAAPAGFARFSAAAPFAEGGLVALRAVNQEVDRLFEPRDPTFTETITESVEVTERWPGIMVDLTAAVVETDTAMLEYQGTVESVGKTLTRSLGGAGVQAAFSLGDALVDAAFGARIEWGKFLRQLLADLAKAVVQALILRAILGIASGGSAAAVPLAGQGGTVRRLQAGGAIPGNPNRGDVVPALLTPGEIVLTREQQAAMFNGGNQPITVRVELGPNIAALADAVSVEVERGGARLVASSIVTPRWRRA